MTILTFGKYVLVIDHTLKIEINVLIVQNKLLILIIQSNNVKIVLIILYLTHRQQGVWNNSLSRWLILIPSQECSDMIIIHLLIIRFSKIFLNNHIHLYYVPLRNLLERQLVVQNVINQLPTLISEKNNVHKSSI